MELTKRPRRLRGSENLRKMVRETRMDKSSLMYPMFVMEGENKEEEIPSMTGQYRYSLDRLPYKLEQLSKAGVGSVMFFGIPDHKDEVGSGAYDPEGIVQRALRIAKEKFPELYYVTDVCMCEYTSMAIAVFSAVMMWTMTRRWSFLQKQHSPTWRQVQIWLLRLI